MTAQHKSTSIKLYRNVDKQAKSCIADNRFKSLLNHGFQNKHDTKVVVFTDFFLWNKVHMKA